MGKNCAKKCPRLYPAAGMMRSRQPFGYCRTGWALMVSLSQGTSFAAGFGACQTPCVPGQDSSSADGCPGVPRELPCAQGAHPPSPSPLSFSPTVTSEQIEHLHRRFKQLSRDQLTIRYGASISTVGAIPVPPGSGQSITRAGEGCLVRVPSSLGCENERVLAGHPRAVLSWLSAVWYCK